jgi:hypothetical protein
MLNELKGEIERLEWLYNVTEATKELFKMAENDFERECLNDDLDELYKEIQISKDKIKRFADYI